MKTFDINAVPAQKGRIAIVTGANAGLGYETTVALAKKGVKVIMACRNRAKAEESRDAITSDLPHAEVEVMTLDLSALRSVEDFAAQFLKSYTRLDMLINNAGTLGLPFQLTEDGIESHMAGNYFSHFALTARLFPLLLKTPHSRVVSLSSVVHRMVKTSFEKINSESDYSSMQSYALSKLACLIFAYELQRRLDTKGVSSPISVAAHPGISTTKLMQELPFILKITRPLWAPFMAHSPAHGAEPTLYAALGADVKGGEYFGPQGKQEFKGRAGRVDSSPLSKDVEMGHRLWKLSEKQSGVTFKV